MSLKASKKNKDTFSYAEMTEDGKTYLLRFKENQLQFAESGKYPYQVGIATPLQTDQNGFPSRDENAQLFSLEEILIKEFAKDDTAIFVGSIVGGGMKELIFYTGDHEKSAEIFERLRDEIKHHEIECVIHNDPEWKNYKVFTGQLSSQ